MGNRRANAANECAGCHFFDAPKPHGTRSRLFCFVLNINTFFYSKLVFSISVGLSTGDVLMLHYVGKYSFFHCDIWTLLSQTHVWAFFSSEFVSFYKFYLFGFLDVQRKEEKTLSHFQTAVQRGCTTADRNYHCEGSRLLWSCTHMWFGEAASPTAACGFVQRDLQLDSGGSECNTPRLPNALIPLPSAVLAEICTCRVSNRNTGKIFCSVIYTYARTVRCFSTALSTG